MWIFRMEKCCHECMYFKSSPIKSHQLYFIQSDTNLNSQICIKVSTIITTDNSLHTATLKPRKFLLQWELIGNKCWLFKQSAALHPTYVCQMTTQTSNRKAHRSKTDAILPHCVGDKKNFIVFIALWYKIFRGIRNESQWQSTIK